MKKAIALIVSLLMCLSLALFVGCGEKETTGTIKGDYKEPTQEELTTAVTSIDVNKLFGDMSAENWMVGLKLDENFSVNAKMGEVEATASTNGSYKLSVSGKGENMKVAGSGEINAAAKVPAELTGEQAIDTTVKVKAQNDMTAAYLEVKMGEEEALKVKANFDDLGDMIPMAMAEVPALPGMNTAVILAQMKAFGVKVEMDNKDGLKLKLSASKETFDKIVELVMKEINPDLPEDEQIEAQAADVAAAPISFSKTVLEVYISIDKDGKLVAVAMNMDVEASVDATAFMDEAAADTSVKVAVKGGFTLNVTGDKVTLPEGLATDTSYVDIKTAMGGGSEQQKPNVPEIAA